MQITIASVNNITKIVHEARPSQCVSVLAKDVSQDMNMTALAKCITKTAQAENNVKK